MQEHLDGRKIKLPSRCSNKVAILQKHRLSCISFFRENLQRNKTILIFVNRVSSIYEADTFVKYGLCLQILTLMRNLLPKLTGCIICFVCSLNITVQANGFPEEWLRVKGTITDVFGKPIRSVNIGVPLLMHGTITDLDGNFALTVPENTTLQISYIGKQTIRLVCTKELQNHPLHLTMIDDIPTVLQMDIQSQSTCPTDEKAQERSIRLMKEWENETNERAIKESKEQGLITVDYSEIFFFQVIEEGAKYPGGLEALEQEIRQYFVYPEPERYTEVGGTVEAQFTIQKEGTPTDFFITKSVSPNIDAAMLTALKNMKTWQPAKQRGKPIPTSAKIAIRLSIETPK